MVGHLPLSQFALHDTLVEHGFGDFAEAGLCYSSSVLRNGRPRWPLNWRRSRRSLELVGRWLPCGARRSEIARRAWRPFSQSSHEMGRSIGIVGISDFEFIGNLADQFGQFRQHFIPRRSGEFLHFRPVNCDTTGQSDTE